MQTSFRITWSTETLTSWALCRCIWNLTDVHLKRIQPICMFSGMWKKVNNWGGILDDRNFNVRMQDKNTLTRGGFIILTVRMKDSVKLAIGWGIKNRKFQVMYSMLNGESSATITRWKMFKLGQDSGLNQINSGAMFWLVKSMLDRLWL